MPLPGYSATMPCVESTVATVHAELESTRQVDKLESPGGGAVGRFVKQEWARPRWPLPCRNRRGILRES